MEISLITEYPTWLIIICLLVSLVYAFLLYRKDSRFSETSKKLIKIMSGLRFLSVFFISLFLLSPLVRSISKLIEKPIIIITHDNSESIVLEQKDSNKLRDYKENFETLIQKLSDKYDVKLYSFGEKTRQGFDFSFTDKQSDFSDFFSEIKTKYTNRNVGAVVLASDGIYNKGMQPVYAASNLDFPVYSIALGDTAQKKDIVLSQVKANKIAFLGNKFPIKAFIDAHRLSGKRTKLKVYKGKRIVFQKTIKINSDNFSTSINIEIEAKRTGIQRYRIVAEALNSEKNILNNQKDIIIDVIDTKQKVLILAHSPHPDIGAIRSTLEKNPNYEVEYSLARKFNKSIKKYNLVILHQLPAKTQPISSILSQINKEKTPTLFIVGNKTALYNLNNLRLGLVIQQRRGAIDETQPVLNEKFTPFEINTDWNDWLSKVPPMISPFGNYRVSGNNQVLFYQKIKGVKTKKPLFILNSGDASFKSGIICGEGIWRWKIYNYIEEGNHEYFDNFIGKTVQYLALKVNKEHFSLKLKNVFNENEPINFVAEVYNESFEAISDATIEIEINNADDDKYNYTFSLDPSGNKNFYLNAGIFPVGDYTYTAIARDGDKTYKKEGRFAVIPVDFEAINTVANHGVLYRLSKNTGGKLVYPDSLNSLQKDLENDKNIVSISYSSKQLQDIIHYKWLFFIILALLSIEWFMRKYSGNY